MSNAEKFISEHTKKLTQYGDDYFLWITPDNAKEAVKIAREEMIEWIDNHWREYVNVDADGVVCFGHWKNDLRKAMKDE